MSIIVRLLCFSECFLITGARKKISSNSERIKPITSQIDESPIIYACVETPNSSHDPLADTADETAAIKGLIFLSPKNSPDRLFIGSRVE